MFSSHRSLWEQVSDGADDEKDAAADRKSRRDTEKATRADGHAGKGSAAVSGSALAATKPTLGERLAQVRETIADGYSPDAIVYKFRERPLVSSLVATAAVLLFGGTVWFMNHRSMPPKFDASGQMHHSYIPGPEN